MVIFPRRWEKRFSDGGNNTRQAGRHHYAGGQEAKFTGVEAAKGRYQTETAVVLSENGRQITTLYPADPARQTTTEAIRSRLSGDPCRAGDGDGKRVYAALYHKPLVSFIWLGNTGIAILLPFPKIRVEPA